MVKVIIKLAINLDNQANMSPIDGDGGLVTSSTTSNLTFSNTNLSNSVTQQNQNEQVELALETGKIIFVTGPNGVGKSSLLAEISNLTRKNGANVEIFFGNRLIQFPSDDVDQVGQSLEQLQIQMRTHVTRYRHLMGEQHLKSVVRRIIDHQAQATHDVFQAQIKGSTFEQAKAKHPLLITSANSVFATAKLPIQIELVNGHLRARRNNNEYGIDRLSDGERAALLLVGAVLIQPENSFILIDEPERHLNPAISGVLLAALVRKRQDIGFIFSSHDLQLLDWLHPDQVIHLRNSLIIKTEPESRQYDMTIFTNYGNITDELKFAILGNRRMLLLVEGEISSEDQALYGHIYSNWNVIPRGGCETVLNGVRALNKNHKFHWLKTVGIIDRDGRNDRERTILAADNIFCLPVPTIENLFLHPTLLQEMGAKIYELKGGKTGEERISHLKEKLKSLLHDSKEDIIIRWIVWEVNRRNSEQKVSIKSIRNGQLEISRIDVGEIRNRLEQEFDLAISNDDLIVKLSELPLKNSTVPTQVAKLLGFDNFNDYKQSVLQQIEVGSKTGRTIIEILNSIMPQLPS